MGFLKCRGDVIQGTTQEACFRLSFAYRSDLTDASGQLGTNQRRQHQM